MNKEYIDILTARMEYFEDKKINDLTDDEIKEFMNLRVEIIETFGNIKEVVSKTWEVIKPYAEAGQMYNERVLNK